jgi:carboxylesterase type B
LPPGEKFKKNWNELYEPVETDEQALASSCKVTLNGSFAYPNYATIRVLLHRDDLKISNDNSQGFELYRYYFDRGIDTVDAKNISLGTFHGAELVYLFGVDYTLDNVFTEEEKNFSEKLQTTWILFSHGLTSNQLKFFPAKITRSLDEHSYHEANKEAIVFTNDFRIERTNVLRLNQATLEF